MLTRRATITSVPEISSLVVLWASKEPAHAGEVLRAPPVELLAVKGLVSRIQSDQPHIRGQTSRGDLFPAVGWDGSSAGSATDASEVGDAPGLTRHRGFGIGEAVSIVVTATAASRGSASLDGFPRSLKYTESFAPIITVVKAMLEPEVYSIPIQRIASFIRCVGESRQVQEQAKQPDDKTHKSARAGTWETRGICRKDQDILVRLVADPFGSLMNQ